VTAI
jgi:elongator complex protein 2